MKVSILRVSFMKRNIGINNLCKLCLICYREFLTNYHQAEIPRKSAVVMVFCISLETTETLQITFKGMYICQSPELNGASLYPITLFYAVLMLILKIPRVLTKESLIMSETLVSVIRGRTNRQVVDTVLKMEQ